MTQANTSATKAAGRDLPAAIVVGVALVVVAAVGLLYLPWFFVAFMTLAFALGAHEVHVALQRLGMHSSIKVIITGTVVSVIGGYLAALQGLPIERTTLIVTCLVATLIAALVARLAKGPEGFVLDSAASALIIAYIPLPGVFISLLMGETQGNLRIVAIIACVVFADVGAYAVGSLLGRHKLAPRISPGKTWEGLIGGVALAGVAGLLSSLWFLAVDWWVGLILGVTTALAATLGDLVESLIKRNTGLKDMSNLLPGHGGVMDRLDSMIMAFPVGWFVLFLAMGT
ncbi:MAG: phosphatidate cytidylyltransferase [Arachnia propionica]|nr:MAG: phosphatidate cytidylyltransferase [Arachnia propionica]